ncbi:MAG TPA: hypothetical protein VI756_31525 [Blastocatellia bacterium]
MTKIQNLWPLIAIAFGLLAIPGFISGGHTTAAAAYQDEGRVRDEVAQDYQLNSGARVEVYSINGPVEIESGPAGTAHVHIIRTAPTQSDLDRRRVLIDASPAGLEVHEEKNRSEARVNTHVILTVPSSVNLSVHGVNGAVKASNIEGQVNVNGVNGRVQIGQALQASTISGINGAVVVNLVQLGQQGLHINGINGAIELHFSESLNANLAVDGVSGGVYTEVPNMTVQGRFSASNFRAQLGSGGPTISLSGINGRVHITGN